MLISMSFLAVFCLSAAQNSQKTVLSDEVLDRLNELEQVYIEYIKSGMSPEVAQLAAARWQDKRYPVYLNPLPKEDFKKKADKTEKEDSAKKKDE